MVMIIGLVFFFMMCVFIVNIILKNWLYVIRVRDRILDISDVIESKEFSRL